jgi:hypothetical protein
MTYGTNCGPAYVTKARFTGKLCRVASFDGDAESAALGPSSALLLAGTSHPTMARPRDDLVRPHKKVLEQL